MSVAGGGGGVGGCVSCEAADVAVTVTGGSRPDPEQSCVCFSYLYFLLNDLSHAGHLYMRSPTEWTSLRCLCILFRVVSTLQTIHLANFVFPGTTVHKPGIIDEVILRSRFLGGLFFVKSISRNFFVKMIFLWNFEVKNIFGFVFWGQDREVRCYCNINICHYYCEPHDLCVSDWPNVFLLYTLWNSMDKLLEIGAAKNGFHENDVAHWVWIEIWSRKSNNKIRNHLPMEQPLLGLVLLQKNKSKRYFQKQIEEQFFVNYCVS